MALPTMKLISSIGGQPGALNEHISDVFAIMCDQWFNEHTVEESSWLIGKGLGDNQYDDYVFGIPVIY